MTTEERSREKILFVGLSKAGKTSIFEKFFLRSDLRTIENINPTLWYSIKKPNSEFTGSRMTIFDLGGQSHFREQYLQSPSLFSKLRAVYFILDIQAPELYEEVVIYFNQVIQLVEENNEDPIYSVFFHKYDPGTQEELSSNLAEGMELMREVFQKRDYVFHVTSIYDETVHREMSFALFRSFPEDAAVQAISSPEIEDFIEQLAASHENLSQPDRDELLIEAKNLGNYLGLKIRDRWLKIALEGPDPQDPIPRLPERLAFKWLDLEDGQKIEITSTVEEGKESDLKTEGFVTEEVTKGILSSLGWTATGKEFNIDINRKFFKLSLDLDHEVKEKDKKVEE